MLSGLCFYRQCEGLSSLAYQQARLPWVFAAYCLRKFEFGGEEARSEECFVRVILFEWRSKAVSKCDVMEDDDWVTGPLTERFRVAFRPTSKKERPSSELLVGTSWWAIDVSRWSMTSVCACYRLCQMARWRYCDTYEWTDATTLKLIFSTIM